MNSTEINRVDALAQHLFDDNVLPAAAELHAVGASAYFPLAGSEGSKSYFETPALRIMRGSDFDVAGGGSPEGLVDALAAYWTARGETSLAAMAPQLERLAEALRDEAAEATGEVDILCYTMF